MPAGLSVLGLYVAVVFYIGVPRARVPRPSREDSRARHGLARRHAGRMEAVVRAGELDWTILRPSALYHPPPVRREVLTKR